uniref:NET domain-containing protein n=1 Tax=viral metagenome TaxID=1070528 RepID=A0A6C0EJC2_9ZZZZ
MSNQEYSTDDKTKLKQSIEKLEYNQLCQIYNIIAKDTDKISENNNGVFINLKYLNNGTMDKLFKFVDYCHKNKSSAILKNLNNDTLNNDTLNNDTLNNETLNNRTLNNDNLNNLIELNSAETTSLSDVDQEQSANYFNTSEVLSEEYNLYNLNIGGGEKNSDFIFKNYIDKLSSNNFKEFNENTDKKIVKPSTNNNKIKLNGVKYRLIKKCREINKLSNSDIVENIINNFGTDEVKVDYNDYSLNELQEEY